VRRFARKARREWRARVEFEDGRVLETPVRFLCPKTREDAEEALRRVMEALARVKVKRVRVW